jgi:hypothetical protein
MHFPGGSASDKTQYFIGPEYTGVRSSYKNHEIEIRKLPDAENGYTGLIMQFRKRLTFFDSFISPDKHLIYSLTQHFKSEFVDFSFVELNPGGVAPADIKDKFLYQSGALNINWKEDDKISPLTLYTKQGNGKSLVELLFHPECYERKLKKTALKNNWPEIFNRAPRW